jgi:hypothetical protein
VVQNDALPLASYKPHGYAGAAGKFFSIDLVHGLLKKTLKFKLSFLTVIAGEINYT